MLLRTAFLGILVFLSSSSSQAQTPQSPQRDFVFDARHSSEADGDKEVRAKIRASSEDLVRAAFGADRALKVSWGPLGRPRAISRLGAPLATTEAGDAEAQAREFLTAYGPVLGLSPSDATGLHIVQKRTFGAVTQVRLQQEVAGLRVWGGQTTVALNSRGEVVQVLAEDLRPGIGMDPRTTLTPEQAIAIALREVGVDPGEHQPALARQSGRWSLYRSPAAGAVDIPLQLVAFPLRPTEARPAYRVYADSSDGGSYELLIDARSGALLYRANQVRHATARVFPLSPIHGERELIELPEDWLDAGSLVTKGNRVDAFRDLEADGVPDEEEYPNLQGGRPFSETQEFDFEAGEGSTGQDPRDFRAAAATNLFYHANRTLDAFYELGFTEEAGNFQQDNLGRGGEAGDALLSIVFDGFGAAYLPRPDGVPARVRMGLESNGTFDRTDDYDTAYSRQIIVHEVAHGLTSRLVGGSDRTDCLSTRIADGLSEGWSDYFAISYTDDPIFGGYSRFAEPRSGIRRQSYEGYTFQHQDLGNEGFQVHRDGEIWAAALWSVRQQLGAETTDLLVADALPLTPCSPSMAEAKDAVLMADALRFEGANRPALDEAFARHGLGFSSSGIDGLRLVESVTWNAAFDLPPVEGENQNPVITGRIPEPFELGDELVYPIPVEDADGDALTFTLLDGPVGLRVDETGTVRWPVDRFGPKRVLVEITDGRGGRIIHGFTTPIVTTFDPGEELLLTGDLDDVGLFYFELTESAPLMRIRMRADSGAGDADFRVFPPSPPSASSFRIDTSNEALSYDSPEAGRWAVRVTAETDFSGVLLDVVFPEIANLAPNEIIEGLQGDESDETFFAFTIPEGVEAFTVSMAGGPGHADLLVAKDRLPTCQFGLVSKPCVYDGLSAARGTNSQTVTFPRPEGLTDEAKPLAVEPGSYFVNVSAHDSYSEAKLLLTLDTGQRAPRISRFGVVNGASFRVLTAPGSIASLFGANLAGSTASADTTPLPRILDGVEVLVDGSPAPLYFVSEGQINFQIPFEAEPFTEPSVMVRRDGAISAFEAAFVTMNAPEIFTYNRVADVVEPVIVHSDFSLVTPENPARPDEIVVVFVTGLGQLFNAPASGEPAGSAPLATLARTMSAFLDGEEARVFFAGLTPGLVGLGQINVQAPSEAVQALTTQTLLLRIGSYFSQPVELWLGPATP